MKKYREYLLELTRMMEKSLSALSKKYREYLLELTRMMEKKPIRPVQELVEELERRERIRVNGDSVVCVLRRKEKTIDDDLPRIAAVFRELRCTNPEPGL